MSSRPFEQGLLARGIDVEMQRAAVRPLDGLGLEIDRDGGVGAALGVVHQQLQLLGRDDDRQDAVLEAVVVEDVGKAGRDDAADAEIEQRPRRVLARRAAAEIVAGDDDLGVAVGRLVEDEIGVLRAVVVVAHLREQRRAEPGPLDRLEVLLGAGRWRSGLCPFHHDHNPSLRVNAETGAFRCMACGRKGGDVLDFHRARHGLSFVQAARDLGAMECRNA